LKWLTVLLGRKVADESPVLVLLLLVLHPLRVLVVLVRLLASVRLLAPVLVRLLVQAPALLQAKLTYQNSVKHKKPWRNSSVNVARCPLK